MQMWGRFFFLWFKFVFNFPIVRLCPSFRFTTHPEFFFRKNKLPTFVPNFSSRETPAKNPSTIDTAHCIHLFFLFAAISAILLSVPKPIFFYYYYYFLDEIPLPSKYLFSVQYRPGETKTRWRRFEEWFHIFLLAFQRAFGIKNKTSFSFLWTNKKKQN